MPETQSPGTTFYIFVGIVAAIVLSLVIYGLITFFRDFSTERKYINCEIRRTVGRERRYWIKRRRKLWLSLIPFVKY